MEKVATHINDSHTLVRFTQAYKTLEIVIKIPEAEVIQVYSIPNIVVFRRICAEL